MADLKNDRLLRVLRKEAVDCTPIWIMRQAGRYLPEYRRVREQAGDFLTLCKTPELACEVTLQPIRRFALDAAILFSDILTIPDAMGLGLSFAEGEGPRFASPIRELKDIDNLQLDDPYEKLGYVMETVKLLARELSGNLPLIGFSGSPWTLATYMVEGGSSRDFAKIKGLLFQTPEMLHRLLTILQAAVTCYLQAQAESGVNILMIFDTWGGMLSHHAYQNFSLHYLAGIVAALKQSHPQVPVILFTKGGGLWLNDIAKTGCTGIGLDWCVSLSHARTLVGDQVTLQGNLDPATLYAPEKRLREEVARTLADFGPGSGHIFNLGHGISQDVAVEKVSILVDSVHELSRPYHRT